MATPGSPYDPAARSQREWWVPAGVFVFALGLRVAHLIELRRNDPFFDLPSVDARMYHEWALAIQGGDWLGDAVFLNGPLYPYLLALVYGAFGPSLLAAKLANALLGASACVLVWGLARRRFDARVAAIAAAATAVGEMLIFYGGTLIVANLLVPLAVAAAWATLEALERPTARRFALAGLLTGLAVIARPNLLLYAGAIGLWIPLALRGRAGRRQIAAAVGIFAAGVALCVLPVTVRNRVVGDDWVLVTYAAGLNLYLGNNPDADGTFRVPRIFPRSSADDPWEQRAVFTAVAERVSGEALKPSQVSRFWVARALEWIREHPSDWLALGARKLSLSVNAWEPWNIRSIALSRELSWVLRQPLLPFGVLAPFALAGLWWSADRWRRAMPLYIMLATIFGTMVVFFVLSRYRLPAVPFLSIFAAAGAVGGWDRVRERQWRALAPALALSLALAAFAQRSIGRDDLSLAYYNLANRHAQLEQFDLAIATYWKALRRNPRYLSTYNNLAAAYERNGQPAEAVATWQELRRLAAARGLDRYIERADRHLRALGEQGSNP